MKRRKIFIVLGVLVLVGAIFLATRISSGNSTKSNSPQSSKATDSSAAVVVEVMKAELQPVQTFVEITGRLIPEDKIDIYAEVNGVLENRGKPFKIGVPYSKGEILLNLNDQEARQNLVAQKSSFTNALAQVVPDLKIDYPDIFPRWRDYLLNFDLNKDLPPLPEVETEQQKLFLTGRNVYTQYYNLKQQETRLEKYNIRAPFSGIITEAFVQNGTLVRPGQRIGEFVKTGTYELEAAVGTNELQFISLGDRVTLSPTKTSAQYQGTITRINAKVDQQTQTVKVFIRLASPELKAGMYLAGQVEAATYDNALKISREFLVNSNQVFTVEDSTARLTRVDVLSSSSENAIISGLEEGAIMIQESRNAAFEGSRVNPVLKNAG
jgi:multidrug efflux pump subunit AcrA (membrane-fusion protein)